jgi:hypothetical protein
MSYLGPALTEPPPQRGGNPKWCLIAARTAASPRYPGFRCLPAIVLAGQLRRRPNYCAPLPRPFLMVLDGRSAEQAAVNHSAIVA